MSVCVRACVCVSASLREVRLKLRKIADVLPHTAYRPAGRWVLCQNTISHNGGGKNVDFKAENNAEDALKSPIHYFFSV